MAVVDEQATVVNRVGEVTAVFGGGEKMRVEIPQETVVSNAAAPGFVPPAPSSGGGLQVFVGVVVVILVLAAIEVVGGVAF